LRDEVQNIWGDGFDSEIWDKFAQILWYQAGNVTDAEDYTNWIPFCAI